MKVLKLVCVLLIWQSGLYAATLSLTSMGTFPDGTPSTPYSQAGGIFAFQFSITDHAVVFGDFSPQSIVVGITDWSYRLNNNVIASGNLGRLLLYSDSFGGLFDLCTDLDCNFTIGMAGDALITSLSLPVLTPGTYIGTDFAFNDGQQSNFFPASSTVTVAAPEPSVIFTLGVALSILALAHRCRAKSANDLGGVSPARTGVDRIQVKRFSSVAG
jgi:hypothetical protein